MQELELKLEVGKTYVNRVGEEVKIIHTNPDGSILAHVSLRAIKINLTEKRELTEEQREALLLPVYAPVDHFLKIQVPEGREKYFCNGLESNIEHSAEAEVLVFDEIEFA